MIENIILILAGMVIGIGITCLIHRYNDDRDEMYRHYETRIECLKKDVQLYRDKALIGACSQNTIDIYKELVSKFMDGPNATTDKIFMFEGVPYKPTSFDLSREEGRADTLTVDFVSTKFDI